MNQPAQMSFPPQHIQRVVYTTQTSLSPMMMSAQIGQQIQQAGPVPFITSFDKFLKVLAESQRDDDKYKALEEISENLEELIVPAYSHLMDNLIKIFLRLLQETPPQFIAENNTFKLRKLMLDILLRVSTHECMRSFSKNIQQLLLRVVSQDNEENALTIVKILTDHVKTFRPPFSQDLVTFFGQWKVAYREMFNHALNEKMFEITQLSVNFVDEVVAEALRTCYYKMQLSTTQQGIGIVYYTLIPKATQSVRVLAEMSVFLLVLIQAHRQHLLNEVSELIPLFVRYINIAAPKHLRGSPIYNKDLVDEFHNSQVRALTFIAYTTARQVQFNELVSENAATIVSAIDLLMESFHDEVITQRRDLLMAVKYFFQCDSRAKFTPIIPKMCQDKLLLGSSFTSQDQLRNNAFVTLADILHHVRMNLPYKMLQQIFFIAARNLHDQQLLPYVQTMYGKLMMNFVDPLLTQAKENNEPFHEVLLNAIDALARKARLLADGHLPLIAEKYQRLSPQKVVQGPQKEQPGQILSNLVGEGIADKKKSITAVEASNPYWLDPLPPFPLNDCKNMVRFIIQPIKMMVIALKEVNLAEMDPASFFRFKRLISEIFVDGLKCLDVFMLGAVALSASGAGYPQKSASATIRTKEEKETIDAFIAIFASVDSQLFYQIISEHIEYMVERIAVNPVLQSVVNAFFMQPLTSYHMGTVLVKFLLNKLPTLGMSNEKASLYLKLFKLVFQAVSYKPSVSAPVDGENILKPFLHQIVQESMRHALRCRESLNYFLLLRALFRSIGNGAHDSLYQQFLPLLPSILQQLNRLQNGSHRQPIHELFVELCLTVPVRLSSLLPYLPLLMDPLVCAMYGSPSLVQQGLRTLELCVDNLQPEYLYEHTEPVRAALMQGLWRTVASDDLQSALSALRILGKFGGSSRKVLQDAQTLDCQLNHSAGVPPIFSFNFSRKLKEETKTEESSQMSQKVVEVMEEGELPPSQSHSKETVGNESVISGGFPAIELVEAATNLLRTAQTNELFASNAPSTSANALAPRQQAFEVVKTVLLDSLQSTKLTNYDAKILKTVLYKALQNLRKSQTDEPVSQKFFKCENGSSRQLFITALNGLFFAVYNVELRVHSLSLFKSVIKHLTVQAILESSQENFNLTSETGCNDCLDASVLVDAICATLADPCKDYCQPAIVALRFMIDTAGSLLGDRDQACQLPLFSHLLDKLAMLCFRRECYSRLGGCTALQFIIENYPKSFVVARAGLFLDASFEIISALSDEVSSGAIDFASKTLDILIRVCFADVTAENFSKHLDMIGLFVGRLIERIDDPEQQLRSECLRVLGSMAETIGISVAKLLVLVQFWAKSLTGLHEKFSQKVHDFARLSIDAQIAFIELYSLLSGYDTEEPGLAIVRYVSDKSLGTFIQNLVAICRSDESQLRSIIYSTPSERPASSGQANAFQSSVVPMPQMPVVMEANTRLDSALETIRVVAIDALVTRCLQILERLKIPEPCEVHATFSLVDYEDDEDVDLREPQLPPQLKHIIKLLLDCSFNSPVSLARDTAKNGLRKVVEKAPVEFSCRFLVESRLQQIIAEYNEKKRFISTDFFNQLAFLVQLSNSGRPSAETLHLLTQDVLLVIKTESSALRIEDVHCIAAALRLFADLNYSGNPLSGQQVREGIELLPMAVSFFARALDLFPESTETRKNWLSALLSFGILDGEKMARVLLSRENVANANVANLTLTLISLEDASALRNAIIAKEGVFIDYMKEIYAKTVEVAVDTRSLANFELCLFRLIAQLVTSQPTWIHAESELCAQIQSFWRSEHFRWRYSVRKPLTSDRVDERFVADAMEKTRFDVPVYCAQILLAFLRALFAAEKSHDMQATTGDEGAIVPPTDSGVVTTDAIVAATASKATIELLYDLSIVFIHHFVSDFTFIRHFINDEVVSSASLAWRRAAFAWVIDQLKTDSRNGFNDQLTRFLQYIVAPAFHYAFEHFDPDDVVGSAPNPELQNDSNVVSLLCSGVINTFSATSENRNRILSDAMVIVMYQFCSLIVQKCPAHLHNVMKRQQSNRLQSFMYFAWHTLQSTFQRDITEKYAGHLLIANIIDKFAITRKIVLQVLDGLILAHHQDHKEVVRKSLEILVPAVLRRMEDGYTQLSLKIKNAITEESRNTAQVIHCLNIVIRFYKVFYHVRHQLSHVLLGALQRLFTVQFGFEARRLLLEVCDMMIKWEQDRQNYVAEAEAAAASASLLLQQQSLSTDGQQTQQQEQVSGSPTASTSPSNSSEAPPAAQSSSSTGSQMSNTSLSKTIVSGQSPEDVHRPMQQSVIEQMVMLLVRVATSSTDSATGGSSGLETLGKRAIPLLRLAMKVFGESATIKSQVLEKQLTLPSPEQFPQGNEVAFNHQLTQVQVTLDMLVNIIYYLTPQVVVEIFKPLQRSIISCMNCNHSQVVRSSYNIVSKLMEKSKCSVNGLDDFPELNLYIEKFLQDSFTSYANSPNAVQPQNILTTISLLRIIYQSQPAYLETVCLNAFLKMLQRLVRDYAPPVFTYGSPTAVHVDQTQKLTAELLCLCLELVCPRINIFSAEAQRVLTMYVIQPLIDKSAIDKVLDIVIKVAFEMITNKLGGANSTSVSGEAPTTATLSLITQGISILVRMASFLEQRLLANGDLQRNFLQSILYVFENEDALALTPESSDKLRPAFFWGLCSKDRALRIRFFTVFERQFPRDIFSRLLHIFSRIDWQPMGAYFWVIHVIHLLLLSEPQKGDIVQKLRLGNSATFARTFECIVERVLPTIATSSIDAIQLEASQEASPQVAEVPQRQEDEKMDVAVAETGDVPGIDMDATATEDSNISTSLLPLDESVGGGTVKDDAVQLATLQVSFTSEASASENQPQSPEVALNSVLSSQLKLLELANAETPFTANVANLMDLMHHDADLSKAVFLELFRTIWCCLSESERQQIAVVVPPFVTSSIMLPQKDASPSVASCFLEAFVSCEPPIAFRPSILSYIGSTQNCWHLCISLLERLSKGVRFTNQDPALINNANQPTEKLEVLDNLAHLYSRLNEFDQLTAVWKRRAFFDKTVKCLTLYSQGEFTRSREMIEKLMSQLNEKLSRVLPSDQLNSITPAIQTETQLWDKQWINSCKQLSDWTALEHFSNSEEVAEAQLVFETAWHLSDWKLMKDCLMQVEASAKPSAFKQTNMFKLMHAIANFDPNTDTINKDAVERTFLDINKALIDEWRRLPKIVSHSHISIFTDAHLVHEINEASTIFSVYPQSNGGNDSESTGIGPSLNLMNNSVKHVSKAWRNRSLISVDSLSTCMDIYTWRYQHYRTLHRLYEAAEHNGGNAHHQGSFPIHSLAQSQLQLARILRHSDQMIMAQNELNKLHTLPQVHSLDAHLTLDEHLKCLMRLSATENKTSSNKKQDALYEALDMVENTQLQYMKKDQIARLLVNKGVILGRLDKRDEAGRAFSAAAQLDDSVPSQSPVWKQWGLYLENIFLSNHIESTALSIGVQIIACFLEWARMSLPLKSRKPIAKIFWLLKICSTCSPKLTEPIDTLLKNYADLIPLANWVFWANEMLADIQQRPGVGMTELLCLLADAYPQQLFHAIRIELGPKEVTDYIQQVHLRHPLVSDWLKCPKAATQTPQTDESRESLLSLGSLSSITSTSAQAVSQQQLASAPFPAKFGESVEDKRLKLLAILDAICSQRLTDITNLNGILNELDNFPGGAVENALEELHQLLADIQNEQFAKITNLATFPLPQPMLVRLENWVQTFVYNLTHEKNQFDGQGDDGGNLGRLRIELLADFQPFQGRPLTWKVASMLRKWVQVLHDHLAKNMGEYKLEGVSKFLANFKSKSAQIDMFGSSISSKYNAQIAQFMPIFQSFVRHDSICRVIRVRSLNGKIYPFLLERVKPDLVKSHIFQLFSLLNTELVKYRATAQRFVQFAIPQMIYTGANCRLMECGPMASTSTAAQLQSVGKNGGSDAMTRILDGASTLPPNFITFIDIFDEMLQPKSSLSVVDSYYERLSLSEQRYSHKSILELFNQISVEPEDSGLGQRLGTVTVPKDLLSRWMTAKYPDVANLWIARKKLSVHFALLGFVEHALFLSPMTLDGLVLDTSTAQLFFTDYKFDLTKKVSESVTGRVRFVELDANRPVPFRMTSNISNFLDASIEGHVNGALIATARCLNARSLEHWLRPILWDIFSKVAEEEPEKMNVVNPVKRAVDTILNRRLQDLSQFEGGTSKASDLLVVAQHVENLCRMDPSWHPWF